MAVVLYSGLLRLSRLFFRLSRRARGDDHPDTVLYNNTNLSFSRARTRAAVRAWREAIQGGVSPGEAIRVALASAEAQPEETPREGRRGRRGRRAADRGQGGSLVQEPQSGERTDSLASSTGQLAPTITNAGHSASAVPPATAVPPSTAGPPSTVPYQSTLRGHDPRQTGRIPPSVVVPSNEGLVPLPAGLIAKPWSVLHATHLGGDECGICLEGLGTVAGPLLVQLRCRHTFCDACVRLHIQVNSEASCPQCRGPIA
mmetsp:Transcript_16551/g.28364  ORF Transcript_16551/g.28364 Transcript_16551/m.28364 type:complete len:258 (-) Transcript_16551:1154-1927(-)